MTSGTHIYSPAFKKKSHLKLNKHSLEVLQHPSRASISTYKEKGRKALEPPPIVHLRLINLMKHIDCNKKSTNINK
ncbi:unnamed protein product [Cunninghamella echinulata]